MRRTFRDFFLRGSSVTSTRLASERLHTVFAFSLLILAVAPSALADDEDCKVETEPGVFVSCKALLDRAASANRAKAKPKSTKPLPAAPKAAETTESSADKAERAAFAKDVSAAEAARLRDTKIDWTRGKENEDKAAANDEEQRRGLSVLRGAQEDKTPLGQERLRVDHLKSKLYALERSQKPWQRRQLIDLRLEVERALKAQADLERLALGAMQSCRYGKGLTTSVKTFKMTASGPVKLSDAEVRSQAAAADDPVCARNTLVTQEQIDDVNEMHSLRNAIEDGKFGYWDRTKLRAAQDRIARLKQKHFGYKRKTEDIRDVDRVPQMERTDEGRLKVGSGENRFEPLNARNSSARR